MASSAESYAGAVRDLVRVVSMSEETQRHLAAGKNKDAGISFETLDWQPQIVNGRRVVGSTVDGIIASWPVDAKLITGTSFYLSMDAYRGDRQRNTLFACYRPEGQVAKLFLVCCYADLREAGCFSRMMTGRTSNGEQGWEVKVQDALPYNLL